VNQIHVPIYKNHTSQGDDQTIKRLFECTRGCTHLSELLLPMATTAFQTLSLAPALPQASGPSTAQHSSKRLELAERIVDTCHAWRADGPVAIKVLKIHCA
jgi:hypothetical protein